MMTYNYKRWITETVLEEIKEWSDTSDVKLDVDDTVIFKDMDDYGVRVSIKVEWIGD